MILSDFNNHTNNAYRGSDDDAPAVATTDWNMWLRTTNRKISEWAKDPKNRWESLFSPIAPEEVGTVATTGTTTLTGTGTYFTDYQTGDTIIVDGETSRIIDTITSDTVLTVTVAFTNTVTANTFTRNTIIKSGQSIYNLNRRFMTPSDKVYAATSATDYLTFDLCKPEERDRFDNPVFIYGSNPQKLTFLNAPTTDMVGRTLAVPAYYAPNDLTAPTDVIPVDDPYWLVMAVASELAGNELTYADKAAGLNAKANNLYRQMTLSNRKGTNSQPRTMPTNVNPIVGPESE